MIARFSIVGIVMLLFAAQPALAQSTVDWVWKQNKQSTGQVQIKSTTTANAYPGTVTQNASVAKTSQRAVIQPPTLVMSSAGMNRWSLYYAERAGGLP